MHELRRIFSFYKKDYKEILSVICLIIISAFINLLKPWPLAIIVDSVLGNKKLPEYLKMWFNFDGDKIKTIVILSVVALFLYILHSLVSTLYNYRSIKIGLSGLQRVREQLFSTLQSLSLKFHYGRTMGDLIYRASWDAYSVQTVFQQGFISTTASLISLIMMIYVMASLNLKLTFVSVAMIPVLIISLKMFGRRMVEKGMEAQQADSRVITSVQQTITALPLIQSFTREEIENKKFVAHTSTAFKKRLSQHFWELIYWFSATALFGVIISVVILTGAMEVINNRLSIGELFVFLAYLGQFYEPLNQITHSGSTVASAIAGAKRLFEIMDSKDEIYEKEDAKPVLSAFFIEKHLNNAQVPKNTHIINGEIEFDDVWFYYGENEYVLKKISFKILPGERTAIIGPSGAGKSTLMNLIPRFYDPVKGTIKLDGVDLRELRLKDLRKNISVVLQNPLIIPTTVKENIAYGCPQASEEEIIAAAKSASAHLFIEKLPQKYDTVIGEEGISISAGEAQRINIARAFLKDAPILLMDEPTAALDLENEAIVIKTLFNLMKKRTTLIIAHRLETIKNVDKIIALKNGEIIEMGSPSELSSVEGYFSNLIKGIF